MYTHFEHQFFSQLLFARNQTDDFGCMIWDPGWMFCYTTILSSGYITGYLHQMILSILRSSAKCTQAELAHGYKYSGFNLHISTSGTGIECRSSMLSTFGESLMHLHRAVQPNTVECKEYKRKNVHALGSN